MVPVHLQDDLKHNFFAQLPSRIPISFYGFKTEAGVRVNPEIKKIDIDGFKICAEQVKEISINTKNSYSAIIIDCDFEFFADEITNLIERNKIPVPSWITINPNSNKYHVVFLLDQVYKKRQNKGESTENYVTRLSKFKKTYEYFRQLLGGDPAYKLLWTHNPTYNPVFSGEGSFIIPIGCYKRYSLDMLADFVGVEPVLEVQKPQPKRRVATKANLYQNKITGTGSDYRNNTIFLRCMWFARFRPEQDLLELAKLWRDKYADAQPHKQAITDVELQGIVNSVLRYKSENKLYVIRLVSLFDNKFEDDEEFLKRQTELGKRSGKARNKLKTEKIEKMKELLAAGKTREEIKIMLKISERTYERYRSEINKGAG
jgi:hypothetical protein